MVPNTGDRPETKELDSGITVDRGVADIVESCIGMGLTPRASCSGISEEHPDGRKTPSGYLSIQVAPTRTELTSEMDFPSEYEDDEFVERMLNVANGTDWIAESSKAFLLYPVVTFRLVPTRGMLSRSIFGEAPSSLTDAQEEELDQRLQEAQDEYSARDDESIQADWRALQDELEEEFLNAEPPEFSDEVELFELILEEFGSELPGLHPSQRTQFFQ